MQFLSSNYLIATILFFCLLFYSRNTNKQIHLKKIETCRRLSCRSEFELAVRSQRLGGSTKKYLTKARWRGGKKRTPLFLAVQTAVCKGKNDSEEKKGFGKENRKEGLKTHKAKCLLTVNTSVPFRTFLSRTKIYFLCTFQIQTNLMTEEVFPN